MSSLVDINVISDIGDLSDSLNDDNCEGVGRRSGLTRGSEKYSTRVQWQIEKHAYVIRSYGGGGLLAGWMIWSFYEWGVPTPDSSSPFDEKMKKITGGAQKTGALKTWQ